MASQTQGRGYHSTAILLPDARVLSAGDDTVAGGGWESDVAEIYSPPVPLPGRPPRDHLGAARHQVGLPVHDRHVRRRRPGGPDRPRRDDPRQRHEPAPRGARPSPHGRRHPGDRAALGQRRAPRPVHALPPERRRGFPRWPASCRSGTSSTRAGPPRRARAARPAGPRAGAKKKLPVQFLNPKLKVGKAWVNLAVTLVARSRQVVGRHPRPPRPGTRDGLHQEARAEEGQAEAGRLPGAGAARPHPLQLRLQLKVKPAGGALVTIKRNVLKAGPKVALRVPKTGKSAKAVG